MKNNEEQHIQIKPRTINIQVNFTFLFLFQTTMFLQEKLKDDEERRIFTLKCLEVFRLELLEVCWRFLDFLHKNGSRDEFFAKKWLEEVGRLYL